MFLFGGKLVLHEEHKFRPIEANPVGVEPGGGRGIPIEPVGAVGLPDRPPLVFETFEGGLLGDARAGG